MVLEHGDARVLHDLGQQSPLDLCAGGICSVHDAVVAVAPLPCEVVPPCPCLGELCTHLGQLQHSCSALVADSLHSPAQQAASVMLFQPDMTGEQNVSRMLKKSAPVMEADGGSQKLSSHVELPDQKHNLAGFTVQCALPSRFSLQGMAQAYLRSFSKSPATMVS